MGEDIQLRSTWAFTMEYVYFAVFTGKTGHDDAAFINADFSEDDSFDWEHYLQIKN